MKRERNSRATSYYLEEKERYFAGQTPSDNKMIAEESIYMRRTYVDGSEEIIPLTKRNTNNTTTNHTCFNSPQGIVHVNGDGQVSHKILSPYARKLSDIRNNNVQLILSLVETRIRQGYSTEDNQKFVNDLYERFDMNKRLSKQMIKDYEKDRKILDRINYVRTLKGESSFTDVQEIPEDHLDTRTKNDLNKRKNGLPKKSSHEVLTIAFLASQNGHK